MKVFVASITAVGCIVGGYLVYETGALRKRCDRLETSVRSAVAAVDELAASQVRADQSTRIADLAARLARVEENDRAAPDPGGSTGTVDLSEIQAALVAQDEEIAEIRNDLEGVRTARGALDRTADRLLSAVGQGDASTEGGQAGGLSRLMEIGSLMRKRPEDLTDEERARRDEITSQLRSRQAEWAVRGFERSLDVKLDDQQRAGIQQLLTEETASLRELRGQELTDEQRDATRNQVRSQTDQRAAGLLSTEQYESWTSYRSRPARRGLMERFGQGGGR
jgi:hypothetical protein